jgi:hypothetical protein
MAPPTIDVNDMLRVATELQAAAASNIETLEAQINAIIQDPILPNIYLLASEDL